VPFIGRGLRKRFSRPCQENLQSPFPPGLNVASLGHGSIGGGLSAALDRLRSPVVREKKDARAFYETEALRSGWSVRQLNRQIESQFYERIALSKNKASMLEKAEHAEPGDAITSEELQSRAAGSEARSSECVLCEAPK
jgi:hypothetical protein